MRPRGRFKCKNNALGIYYKNNFDHLLIVPTNNISKVMKKGLFLAVASAVLFCGNGMAQEIKDSSQKLDAQEGVSKLPI